MEFPLPMSTSCQAPRHQTRLARLCRSLAAPALLAIGVAGCHTAPPQAGANAVQNPAATTAAAGMTGTRKAAAMAPIPAGWSEHKTAFPNHPTWTFMPSTTLPTGKHALMVVLHGCNQTHNQMKQFGNLENVAAKRGIVLAIPDVGNRHFGTDIQRCWSYDMAQDNLGHMDELIGIAETLADTGNGNNIDRNHVYVVGLSSGAAMALDVACKRPDLFAGVGAVAGPSVGSNQNMAFIGPLSLSFPIPFPSPFPTPFPTPFPIPLPLDNVTHATETCKALAAKTGTASQFATQISSIAVGDMDREGANARFSFQPPIDQAECANAGKIALVSVRWNPDNVEALRRIYGAGALGSEAAVQGGLATKRAAMKDGKERISFVTIKNVGHAWPAGAGSAQCNPTNDPHAQGAGVWIAQQGLNYPEFISEWLMTNNIRAGNP